MDASNCDVAFTTWNNWHDIVWPDVYQVVGRLQVRIAKATSAGDWRKVKSLQRLLTQSTSAKALAVRRVTENRGHKTPGVDLETWDSPETKLAAVFSLHKRGYNPKPLRRVHIPKSSGGKRPLGIPTMKDRAMQALHLLALDPVSETTGDQHSYGFRRERSTTDAIEQVRNALGRAASPRWVLEGDIKGCFDNISHDWLMRHVPLDRIILKKWLKSGYFEGKTLFPTSSGTPQGGIISPVLSNLALDGLQRELECLFKTVREARKEKVNFIRYADDFIITASSQEFLAQKVKPLLKEYLKQRGLELSETKTLITHVKDGFDFLGWNVRLRNQMLLIEPSKKNVTSFLEKVRSVLREYRSANQMKLIEKLNPIIRGWANYHRSQMATRIFRKCDHRMWEAIWHWAKRRHPNKGKRWIKKRYFTVREGRDWRFTCNDKILLLLTEFHKKTHIKIRTDANPYLPEHEQYFADRANLKMKNQLEGRRKLLWIWRGQNGICPICEERITRATGWHLHHIVRRTDGGSDKCSNLEMLHPNCHRQHHSQQSLASAKQ